MAQNPNFIQLFAFLFFSTLSNGHQQTLSSPSSSSVSPFDALQSHPLGAFLCIPRIFVQCPQMNSYFSSSAPLKELLFNLDINWPKSKVEAVSYCRNIHAFQGCLPEAIVQQCSLPADAVHSVAKMYINPYLERYQKLVCKDEQAQIRFLNRANCYRKEEVRAALTDFIHRSAIFGKEMKLSGEGEEDSRRAMCCMALYGSQALQSALMQNCGQEVAEDVEKVIFEELGASFSVKLLFTVACSGAVQLSSVEDCARSLKTKSSQKSLDFALKLSPIVKREAIEEMVVELGGRLSR